MSTACKYIFSIESSCDDTSMAVVGEDTADFEEIRVSQLKLHNEYGGVVPELASREHFKQIDQLYKRFASQTEVSAKLKNCHKVVATVSPGLVGPLLVGSSYARGLASAWGLPFEGIHHLRGHLASVLLCDGQKGSKNLSFLESAQSIFPAIVLLVSGGHTAILEVGPQLEATLLAQTADDAAGECFDKTAKLMGLPYPGGPSIEKCAAQLNSQELGSAQFLLKKLPIPKSKEGFSFSGLKTAIRLQHQENKESYSVAAFSWAVQNIIAQTLAKTLEKKLASLESAVSSKKSLIFCGGVSANQCVRDHVLKVAQEYGLNLIVPPLNYCTDNAAMIGACARVQSKEFVLSSVEPRAAL